MTKTRDVLLPESLVFHYVTNFDGSKLRTQMTDERELIPSMRETETKE